MVAAGGGLQLPALVQRIVVDASQTTQAEGKVKGFANRTRGAFGGILATTAKLAGIAGFGMLGVSIGRETLAVDKGLREVNTLFGLTGKAAADSFSSMQKDVRGLSDSVGVAQEVLVGGLYQAISAGVPRENAFTFLEVASKAAIAGVTDTETAVDGLTTIINAFGLEASDAGAVADSMFAAVKGGKTTFSELSDAMFNVAPAAAALSVDFKEVNAAIATLTAAGTPTSVATTQIRAALTGLTRPTDELKAVFNGLGFESAQAAIEQEGLGFALKAVRDAADGDVGALQKLLGSVEAVAAVNVLAGTGAEKFATELENQKNSAGATQVAFEEMSKSVSRQWEVLWNRIKNVGMTAAAAILPVLSAIMGFLLDQVGPVLGAVFGGIGDLLRPGIDAVKRFSGSFSVVKDAVGGLYELIVNRDFTGAFGRAFNLAEDSPVVATLFSIRDAVAGALERITTAARGFADFITDTVVPAIRDRLQPVLDAVGSFIQRNLAPILTGLGGALAGLFGGSVIPLIGSLAAVLGGALLGVLGAVAGVVLSFVGAVATVPAAIGLVIGAVIGAYQHFDGFRNVVDGVVSFITGTAAPGIAGFATKVADGFASMRPILESVVGFIRDRLGGLVSFISNNWRTIPTVLSAVWGFVQSTVLPIVAHVVAFIAERIGQVVAFVRDNWALIGDATSNIWAVISGAIKAAVTVIAGVVLGVVAVVRAVWSMWGDELMAVVRIAWGVIQAVIKAAMGVVLGIIKTVLAIIGGNWGAAWDGIKQVLANVWNAIWAIVGAAIRSVGVVIEGGLSLIRGIWNNAWNLVKGVLTAAWDFIWGKVSEKINAVRSTVQTVMGVVRGVWDSAWGAMRDTVSTIADAIGRIWGGIKRLIGAPINVVVGFVNTLGGGINKVTDFLGMGRPVPTLDRVAYHEGGVVGTGGSGRKARRGGLRRDEEAAILQKGEGVLPADVMAQLGKDRFEELRKGNAGFRRALMAGRPPKADPEPTGRPEIGGFPGVGLVKGLIQKGIDALLDNAQKAVRGLMETISAPLRPFGKPGEIGGGLFRKGGDSVIKWLDSLKSEASQAKDEAQALGAGPPLGGGIGWRRMWDALRAAFPTARLHSAFRPGAITATGRASYHGMGRAIDVSPWASIGNWIRKNYMAQTREMIFSPMGGQQINNGRNHFYTGITRQNHWNHVHWAMKYGGRALANKMQLVGENGPELVVPRAPMLTLDQERTARVLAEQARAASLGLATTSGNRRGAGGSVTYVDIADGAVVVQVDVHGHDDPEAVGRQAGGAAGRQLLAVIKGA